LFIFVHHPLYDLPFSFTLNICTKLFLLHTRIGLAHIGTSVCRRAVGLLLDTGQRTVILRSQRRGNGGGDGRARLRNVETTGARVSFRPRNIFPDFCMLFLKLPVVIYLVFYCEMHDNCHSVAYNKNVTLSWYYR